MLQMRRPIAPVRVDAAELVGDVAHDVGRLRGDGKEERMISVHDAGHPVRLARITGIDALSAVLLVGQARFIESLILRCEGGLLSEPAWLVRIPIAALAAAVSRP